MFNKLNLPVSMEAPEKMSTFSKQTSIPPDWQ